MMTISLELPEGVAPPKMRGTLTGPPDDLRIEIRLADFVSALKEAQAAGATVQMVPHGVVIDKPPADPPTSLPFKLHKPAAVKKVAAKKAAKTVKPKANAMGRTMPAAEPAQAPNREAILAFLGQGPATRTEVLKNVSSAMHTTEQSIEQAFYKLKDLGLIEKFEDEANGGLPKWRLVTK